jgi:hypothetical protein
MFFAEELAQIDLPAALKLLEGMEDKRDSHLGRIAHELAAKNPAEAERVLMMMRDRWPDFRDNYAMRVCYRMASVDRKRAHALAGAMKDYRLQARALGAMALAIAREDRAAAVALIREAFAGLEAVMDDDADQWNGLGTAATAAAGLLPLGGCPGNSPSILRTVLVLRSG